MKLLRNLALIFWFLTASSGVPATQVSTPLYTAATAPDKLSRGILARRLTKIDEGAPQGVDASPTIHRNFSQLIDQNFARLDPIRMARLLDSLGDNELSDLAQLYVNAAADIGSTSNLLDVMALRLDVARLGRVSLHFGFAPVYEAVVRSASQKTMAFQQHSQTWYAAPVPGVARFGPRGKFFSTGKLRPVHEVTPLGKIVPHAGLFAAAAIVPLGKFFQRDQRLLVASVGEFLNYTPYEIYLSFRTAPVGALGVTGSLYETTVLMSKGLIGPYFTGYAIGSALAPVIQTYAPSLWDAIGGTINQIIDNIFTAPDSQSRGAAEATGAASFELGPVSQVIEFTGGDFGVANDWYEYSGGGGGGGMCPLCELV